MNAELDRGAKQFGGARYSSERRSLVMPDGTELLLRAKSLAVFNYLAEHADTVVDKQTLFDALWPGLVVTDGVLTQCTADIRRALNDSDHQILRTLPRQGYMLVADARPETATTAEPLAVIRPHRRGAAPPPGSLPCSY